MSGNNISEVQLKEELAAVRQQLRVEREKRAGLEKKMAKYRQSQEAAEAANQAKTTFLSYVSHELRAPLTIISGYAQLLQSDPKLEAEQQEQAAVIEQTAEYLAALSSELLDLAQIEAGELNLEPAGCYLPGWLEELAAMFSIQVEQKGLGFQWEVDPALPKRVVVDSKRLLQILLNLLNNALKFTAEGEIVLRARFQSFSTAFEAEVPDSLHLPSPCVRLRFEVEDTGPGIPAAELTRIFEPFHRANNRSGGRSYSKVEGTGLGLAISRGLAQAMGGRLQAQSQVGQGSLFWLELDLPVMVMASAADEKSSEGASQPPGPVRFELLWPDVV